MFPVTRKADAEELGRRIGKAMCDSYQKDGYLASFTDPHHPWNNDRWNFIYDVLEKIVSAKWRKAFDRAVRAEIKARGF